MSNVKSSIADSPPNFSDTLRTSSTESESGVADLVCGFRLGKNISHVNSRIPIMPSRRNIITTISSNENITILMPGIPGIFILPIVIGFSTNLSHSSIVVTSAEPIIEPVTLPSPPTTIIIKMLYVCVIMNIRGSIVVIRFPINAPPSPPPKQPNVNASTLTRNVFIPIIRAATSSSLTARRTPPKLLRNMHTIQSSTTPRQPQLM